MLDIDVVGVPEAEALIDTLLLVEMDQLDDGVDVTDGVNEFGVVEEVGSKVKNFKTGDAVFGHKVSFLSLFPKCTLIHFGPDAAPIAIRDLG